MTVLGPGIGEIQINAVHFTFSEYLIDVFCIHTDEFQVGKLVLFHFLDCAEQYAGIFFDSHIIDLRILLCKGMQETSLSHTNLNMDRMIVSENLMPGSGACFQGIFRYDIGTFRNNFPGTGNIS